MTKAKPKKNLSKRKTPKKKGGRYSKCITWLKTRSLLTKILLSILTVFLIMIGTFYGFASYYRFTTRNVPLKWGTSWSFKYANELGIDPYAGLEAVANELPIKRFRFMTYWDMHEPVKDSYDWSDLDFQMNVAKEHEAEVSLAIGLRQPRWPECHMPVWAEDLPREEWLPELKEFMKAVLERYDSNELVVEYQLENEFTLDIFGICPDHDRQRLVEEYNFVDNLTEKPIVVSHGGTFAPTWPVKAPRAPLTAMSIYKRVLDNTVTKGYFEYPYPSWYYTAIAGMNKAHTGVDTFIHELQAEPWGTRATADLSDEEQLESMDAYRLEKRLAYAEATGMKTIDIWGAEWYYWRKTQWNDPSLWQTIQTELPKYN